MICAFLTMGVGAAYAQTLPTPPIPPAVTPPTPAASSQVCTSFSDGIKKMQEDKSTTGLLTDITNYIKDVVNDATEKLFNAFIGNQSYQHAVYAAAALMVTIYGVGFTIGVIQASFGQALIRMIKLGIIVTLIDQDIGFAFFTEYVIKFFADGSDALIIGVMKIGTGVDVPPGAGPFYQLDKIASFIIQPDTLSALLGSFFSGGPFGAAMGGLMAFAFWAFIKLLVEALRTYAVSFIARAMLFGVAPIFIVFLLFDKTKTLFQGWVNLLLNYSLQPVLLFTFLSFFIVLIQSATASMFNTELCWTEGPAISGSTVRPAMWRFVDQSGQPNPSVQTWQGSLSCLIGGGGNCPPFPVNIIDILSFMILVYLAERFAGVIPKISNELSNALASLDATGRIDQYMEQKNVAAAQAATPGNPPAAGQPPRRGPN